MMTSKFYKKNATITVKGKSIDVCVKEDSLRPETSAQIGVSGLILNYVGNVVNSYSSNSKLFPPEIKSNDRGVIVIDEDNITGEWVFQSIQRTRWKKIEKALGQPFSGFLILKKETDPNDWI